MDGSQGIHNCFFVHPQPPCEHVLIIVRVLPLRCVQVHIDSRTPLRKSTATVRTASSSVQGDANNWTALHYDTPETEAT
eukprot:1652577-Prymnesium_polylepis.1